MSELGTNLPTVDVIVIDESCRKPLNWVFVQLSQLLAEQEGGLATNDVDIYIQGYYLDLFRISDANITSFGNTWLLSPITG